MRESRVDSDSSPPAATASFLRHNLAQLRLDRKNFGRTQIGGADRMMSLAAEGETGENLVADADEEVNAKH